jgi:ABC-type Fe3+/spermidine/putrescine transport system ATPase subunit
MLDVSDLTHRYESETAVDDVSFEIGEGELLALLGPSGCGKTTIVQTIAGHVRPTAGAVRLRGEDVTRAPPETRRVSVVFQQSTLYPHMTVAENVAYGLDAREFSSQRREKLLDTHLELVGLASQRDAYPSELSGGQKRRAELARALAPQPDVLVLDEPLSALDRSLRDQLREEIARIQRETGVTTLFVTHDQDDAMALADRIVVLNDGQVAGAGQPRALYESPPNPFVASFLGRSNTLSATVREMDPLTLAVGEQRVVFPNATAERAPGTAVIWYLRPERLSVRDVSDTGPTPTLRGSVTQVADLGRRYDVTVRLESGEEVAVEQTSTAPETGDTVAIAVPDEQPILFE